MHTDLRPAFLIVGALLTVLGVTMLIPGLADIIDNNPEWEAFFASALITILVGLGFFLASRANASVLGTRQAFVMTVALWVVLSAFGALPFLWAGVTPTYTDAFFESISGLTTTGATVISELDTRSTGILLWRGMLQWMGGLGIIVMAVAVLPMLQVGGMQLFKVEAFDAADKILPRATQISGSITLVYLLITIACTLAYLAAGMSLHDAVIHAMTTVSTGGFSSKDASVGYFDSATIEMITVFFMILGSIPFLLYVKFMQGGSSSLWQDSQVRVFLVVLAILVLIAWGVESQIGVHPGNEGLRYALFNVTSIMTGTGYASTNYGGWGQASIAFFFFIMFIGGCAGSTSCGIKIFRFQVLYEDIKQHLNRILYPHGIFVRRFNGQPISDDVSAAVLGFIFLFLVSFGVTAIALSLTGLDVVTALSGAGTAISNVGPGLGELIGPAGNFQPLNDTAKWILSFAMLVGRLELFTVLVLFVPRFWKT